ncbi:MAG: phage baseplate protein [Chthoniobacterales bacterium]|jgi:hypothetical protein|nr:phage baseplate protein [Chthoniobacterales bacterium]
MRALSAAELLDVWERGLAQSPAQRALLLLAVACAETPIEQLAQASIGQRDSRLLAVREQTFGPRLASITTCPACSEQLEFEVNAAEIRATSDGEPELLLRLTQGDYAVEFRLPTSLDLASLDPAGDSESNRRNLLRRCVTKARRTDTELPAAELPAELLAAISQRMSEADPQADVQLSLACPQCHHLWETPFDIVSYFWTEIHAWAGRMLREVHSLASAYGWPEAEVLALSPWRRQAYLELIES